MTRRSWRARRKQGLNHQKGAKAMVRNIPLRHELKFFINEMQYQVLSRQLDRVLWRDPNGDVNNE